MNEVFARRRAHFMQQMGDGVAIIPTHPIPIRSNDVDYPYRPDSTFWYLTGFKEPDAVAVLCPGHADHRFVLFVNPKDPERETWTGRRAGVEGALERFGADAAFPLDQIDEVLPSYLENESRLFYPVGHCGNFDERVLGWRRRVQAKIRTGVSAPDVILDTAAIAHEMRLIKGPEEVERMRRAAQIAAEAHCEMMKLSAPGMYEYEFQAQCEYTFRRRGAQGPSYNPICGSGPNTCILHYNDNDRQVRDGDLVLIDAGCEFDGYASDITRTFPANGVFTADQRALYDLVLAAQLACIDLVGPGVRFQDIHDLAVRTLAEGLVRLGLLEGPVDEAISSERYKRFYMHKTGHWLGMDVHDVGKYKIDEEWRTLAPGMVLTVEPGLYVPAGSEGVDPRWFDMGIRIEDDVLVTETGHEVLSRDVPKQVEDIEALMRQGGTVTATPLLR
ncbi:MAG: aminopeptidase P N-terminal domain-containing protein [Candidatus Sericytochromatia bacterium]|nr:aminopeptidase P N-terminal domain-containing protein [Candidatus Tanganyikabacteria bacterium]